MINLNWMKSSNKAKWLFVATILVACVIALSVFARPEETAAQGTPSWMEPRGLSIVDLINGGLDPSLLANTPIVFQPGQSVLQYVSGSKSGNTVTVNARMLPVQKSAVYCLGQDGIRDQWPIVAPESRMTIRSNGVDITDQVINIQYHETDRMIFSTSQMPKFLALYHESSSI